MSADPSPLDEQQARLVARLRAAGGAPVTFGELRGAGIENPALLCYELAAAGLPITRTASPAEGMPAMSARLEPDPEPPPADQPAVSRPIVERIPRPRVTASARIAMARGLQSLGGAGVIARQLARSAQGSLAERRPSAQTLAAMLALLVAFVAVIAMALGDLTHDPAARQQAAHVSWSRRPLRPAHGSRTAQAAPSPVGARPPAAQLAAGAGSAAGAAQISSAAAVELEAQGHQMLLQGSYASAIPVLSSAIRASGQSLAGCAEPASEACLTFAYALYDLGRALRLGGHHAEAVSILSERLRIDNQRPTVERELELARGARA
jgi:hypothetical protein